MWTQKDALEFLFKKCREYIDSIVKEIVEIGHKSMVGGYYTKIFDIERMNGSQGSSYLSYGKFREFLDWLANIFGYYDKEIEDIKKEIEELHKTDEDLYGKIDDLKDDISQIKDKLDDVAKDVEEIKNKDENQLKWSDGTTTATLSVGGTVSTCDGAGLLTFNI